MKDFLDLSFRRITLGNLISMTTIIVTVTLSYTSIKADIAVVQNDIAWIKKELVHKGNNHTATHQINLK